MTPDNSIVRRAKKVVDAGMNIPLAQLTESIHLNDKLDALLSKEDIKIPEYPEFPEHPTEIAINNLPEVQKVEITNLPKEKDDKEQITLLKEISLELKKKGDYAYDIEIDATLKEQLRGERGESGKDGVAGKNGNEIEAIEIANKLETLEGTDKLHISATQGTEALIEEIATKIAKEEVKKVKKQYVGVGNASSSSSGGSVDSVNGQTGVVVLDTGDIADSLDKRYVTDADLVTLGNTSNTNTGDQLMYGTIAVAGQADLDPSGTGDTLTIVAGTNVTVTTNAGTNELTINSTATGGVNEDSFGIVVDGAGTAITTGSKGTKYIPWDCTVTGWDIRSDISGSCVFDIKRSGVSLAGTEKPTLSAASSNSDLTLSTWTTSLTAGDVVEFVVDSASTLTRATVTILVSKI